MTNFKNLMKEHQIRWRKRNLPNILENGFQNQRQYPHILPLREKKKNFFTPIVDDLFSYLQKNHIQPHTGIHNLLSSWAVCANFYWPFNNADGKNLLKNFLNQYLPVQISKISALELEYSDSDEAFQPHSLLGEDDGMRGSGQTSPDLAIEFVAEDGKRGILLIESKFTESCFYNCSGYTKTKNTTKSVNPDKTRCLNASKLLKSSFSNCHLISWGRKYWDLLQNEINVETFGKLNKCPMASGCYQIFRQQALAKGLKQNYDFVYSCVAADKRNKNITRFIEKRYGLEPFPDGWDNLFYNHKTILFFHNDWYDYVLNNGDSVKTHEWLKYIKERYIDIATS